MQEDMLSIGVKLVGTIGVIEATVQLLFALVFERLLNAFLYRLAWNKAEERDEEEGGESFWDFVHLLYIRSICRFEIRLYI